MLRPSTPIRLSLGLVLLLPLAVSVRAQAMAPAAAPGMPATSFPVAASASASAAASAPAAAPASGREDVEARSLVQIFIDACVATGGSVQQAVDWAVSQGYELRDAEATGSRALLDDGPGSIFSPPGLDGRLMLAIATRGHCLVWADRSHGPGVRLWLQTALGERASRGDRLEVELDRKIERGQVWRQQTQWRLRPSGSAAPLQIGLVNTLTNQPAPQVMRLQPLAATPAFAPDGMPRR